jgi:hypothetical protein
MPTNISESGRVANALSAASDLPASADTTTRIVLPVIASERHRVITPIMNAGWLADRPPLPSRMAHWLRSPNTPLATCRGTPARA